MENPRKKRVTGKAPRRGHRLPRCHYCGAPIREKAIMKIEGRTGERLFYCSGKCCDDDWK